MLNRLVVVSCTFFWYDLTSIFVDIHVVFLYLFKEMTLKQHFETFLCSGCPLELKISPYPLYDIDIPVIYNEECDVPSLKYGKPSRLNSDIYLTCVNAVIDNNEPAEKEIFLLPMGFLDIDEFLGGRDLFVEGLFNVFNSYPALNCVIAPYKGFILKIFVRLVSFQCIWFSSRKIPQNFLTFVDESIALSLRYNRYHYHFKYTDQPKPTTHTQYLFGEDDRLYSKWNCGKRKLNAHVINLQKDVNERWQIEKVVLLLVPCFCRLDDKLNEYENPSNFFDLNEEEQEFVLARFDSAMFAFALSCAEVLMAHRVIEGKLNDTDDDDISSVIALGEKCMQISPTCNAFPQKITNFFTLKLHQQLMEESKLVDYDFISIALRAIYHYYPQKDGITVAPVYIPPEGLNKCFTEFQCGKQTGDRVRLELHDDFSIQDNVTLVFFLQMYELKHTVCAKMFFEKNKNKDTFKTEVTVYDSSYNPTVDEDGDNSEIKYIQDGRYKFDKLTLVNSHTEEREWLCYLTQNHIKYSVVRRFDPKKKWQHFRAHELKIRPSILVQYKDDDNTCAINSFLCALLLVLGKNPEDGIPGILKIFKSIKEYRHSMISLIYLIVSKYLEDSESVIDKFDEKFINLRDDAEYNKVIDLCKKQVSKTNYAAALDEDILRLLDFLDPEMLCRDKSKNGMCELCLNICLCSFLVVLKFTIRYQFLLNVI